MSDESPKVLRCGPLIQFGERRGKYRLWMDGLPYLYRRSLPRDEAVKELVILLDAGISPLTVDGWKKVEWEEKHGNRTKRGA